MAYAVLSDMAEMAFVINKQNIRTQFSMKEDLQQIPKALSRSKAVNKKLWSNFHCPVIHNLIPGWTDRGFRLDIHPVSDKT